MFNLNRIYIHDSKFNLDMIEDIDNIKIRYKFIDLSYNISNNYE